MGQRVQWPFVKPAVRHCLALLPVFLAVRRLHVAWSVWLEMESLLFKGAVRGISLEESRAPAWRLDSLQRMVAGILVGEGVGLGGRGG